MSLLSLDARWRRLHDASRTCPCCGQSWDGMFDIGFDHPDLWPHGDRAGRDLFEQGDDKLTADLCAIGEDRFIRCILPLPIRGSSDEVFHFGCWGSTTRAGIQAYIAASETGDAALFAGGQAFLCNDLPLFATEDPIACDMAPPATAAERPVLMARAGPLAQAQSDGISFDQLLDIYAACDQDMRPHLAQD